MSEIYDLIIVGAGPAGLSAAIYMARAKYRVLVLEQEKIGGQITITSEVVNYPGVFDTSGAELTETMHKQGERFGADFKFALVTEIKEEGDIKTIVTNQGEFQTLSVILALGANPRKLGFQGEEEYQGRGVAYCATCDGEFFKNRLIYVIGGGFAAVEEGIFLTKYASHVHMVVRRDQFSCAQTVVDQVLAHPNITIHYETEVEKVEGDGLLKSITLLDKKTGKLETIQDDKGLGVFVFAGYVPNTGWLKDSGIALENGYIVTDDQGKTNISGIYAAGDVRIKDLRQVVTAVSDGATASTALEKYVENLRKKLDLPQYVPEVKSVESSSLSTTSVKSGDFGDSTFITAEMAQQLEPVLAKMKSPVILKTYVNSLGISEELKVFTQEFSKLSDKIKVELIENEGEHAHIELCHEDGKSGNTSYFAVPSGHEFNSFLLGVLQITAEAKPISDTLKQQITQLKPMKLQVCITLSCSMCPELVQACQRLAFENSSIQTEVIDISHRSELKDQYQIMSVPCLVLDEDKVHFGKKSLENLVELLEKE